MERLAEVKLNNSLEDAEQYAVIEVDSEDGEYIVEFISNIEAADDNLREYSRQTAEVDQDLDVENYVRGPSGSTASENPEIVLREKPGTEGETVSEFGLEDGHPHSFSLASEIQYSHAYDNFEDYLSEQGIDPGHGGFIDWASGIEQRLRHNLLENQDIDEPFEKGITFRDRVEEYIKAQDVGTFDEIRGRKVELLPEDDFRFDGNGSPNFLDQAGLRFHNGILTQKPEEIRELLGDRNVR